MSGNQLSAEEERELYVLLKPQEGSLECVLEGLLRRIEQGLFSRMTIEEIESLAQRFPKRD